MQDSTHLRLTLYLTLFNLVFILFTQIGFAQTATYTYDNLNRLTSATYGEHRINYVYDANGNITQVVTPVGCTNTYYRDADGDGFGDPNSSIQSCALPSGFVENNTDCNDDPSTGVYEHPGRTWYPDEDGDGYYSGVVNTASCSRPAGHFAGQELATTAVQDNCPQTPNPDQTDYDGDGVGDDCDAFFTDNQYFQDSDQDGIADEWELDNFGTLAVADASSDSDNDGLTDIQEFVISMDPNVGVCAQWDANGDGKIGLEEAIRALQITSGSP